MKRMVKVLLTPKEAECLHSMLADHCDGSHLKRNPTEEAKTLYLAWPRICQEVQISETDFVKR